MGRGDLKRGGRRLKDFKFTFRNGILYRLFNNGQWAVQWSHLKRRNVSDVSDSLAVPLHEGRKTRQRRHRRERNRRNPRGQKAVQWSRLKRRNVSDVSDASDAT
eukprot:s2169_g3.t1